MSPVRAEAPRSATGARPTRRARAAPEEAVELGDVVGTEPAPEDEVLRGRDGRDRVDLQEAEVTDGLDDVGRRPVERLDVTAIRLASASSTSRPAPAAPSAAVPCTAQARSAFVQRGRRPTGRLRPDPRGELASEPAMASPASTGAPRSAHTPSTRSTFAFRSNVASTRPITMAGDREDVVAVLALRLRDVHLEPVAEPEQLRRALAVVDEAVERREQDRALRPGLRSRTSRCAHHAPSRPATRTTGTYVAQRAIRAASAPGGTPSNIHPNWSPPRDSRIREARSTTARRRRLVAHRGSSGGSRGREVPGARRSPLARRS